MASVFAQAGAPAGIAQAPPGIPDIVVPEAISRESRQRIAYKIGAHAARQLGLDNRALGSEELMALGRQTVADHAMSGTLDSILVAVARLEGKVDDAAWTSGDNEKVAAQVGAFLQSEFKDEIDLYQALDALAAEPPLLGRGELAAALLREQGIDPGAFVDGVAYDPDYPSVAASSPPLIRNNKAAEYYFNRDRLTAENIRKMKTREGGTPTDEHIGRILRALPDSLDAEFTRRFDHHQQRMSALLAKWLCARLSLHARQAGITLAGAVVGVSRAKMRLAAPAMGMRIGSGTKYSEVYGTRQSRGFVVSIQGADSKHQCFISTHSGAVHVLPAGESAESWLVKEHELAFDDATAFAELGAQPGRWFPRVTVEEKASAAHEAIHERVSDMFRTEIEQGREAARGETLSEATVDALLNLIPFRAMVVALRKGDIPTAIVMGGLDTLSLIPLIGAGVRLTGAAARSAAPWLAMGMRFGGVAGRQGWNGLGRLAGRIPVLHERIRGSLTGSALQAWARLRPLDLQRVAQALRPTAPRLADILDGIAARSRGATIPDGVWRVQGSAAAAAPAGDAIATMPALTARNMRGNTLNLLPYGERAGAYTQIDAAGQRIGALLVADSGGWLHQTMPVASLERHRVASLSTIRTLGHTRANPDGTVTWKGDRYARLGTDYVQVTPDPAVSTALRPVWRVVAPQGVVPDVIGHRLVYDMQEGLWRQADVPALLGGGNHPSGSGLRSRWRVAVPPLKAEVGPNAVQLARFQDELVAGVRDATGRQIDGVRTIIEAIVADRRGLAIMRAMAARRQLLGQAPEIILRQGADAMQARPSLDQPVRGNAWYLDIGALESGTTQAAVDEFAAVYNNMTGVLQNDDPFEAMLANGEPALDPELEQAWDRWRAQAPDGAQAAGVQPGQDASTNMPRELAVIYLRTRLREMICYGGFDKSTFKAILRNERARRGVKIDLSNRSLDSVPPLPRDIKVLNMSHNPVLDWSNLPQGLTVLHAEGTQMTRLPENLPAGVLELDVSNNLLRSSTLYFPSQLVRLDIGNNRLSYVPILPDSVRELVIEWNNLREIPAYLPKRLRLLDVSNNALTRLPAKLPPTLKVLLAGHNRLAQVPASLPAALDELDVSANRLRTLPALPDTLRILDASSNLLDELPDKLPRAMETLAVEGNRLRSLPEDLPGSLRILALQRNAIAELPRTILALASARIYLDGNPLPVASIPVIPADSTGPTIYFSTRSTPDERPQHVRTLMQALQHWWTKSSKQEQSRWQVIAQSMGEQDSAMQFSLFLDLLRTTVSYRDAVFRAQVEEWLVELSKPERKTLLQDTLAICDGAAETCEDRIISVWNDTQNLRLNDDVRKGLYDERPGDVVAIARQMFRLNALTEIARRKERTLTVADEVEVYLSYVVKLRDSLGLTTIAPGMRYYDRKEVTPDDLVAAKEKVLAQEREEFDEFLVLDYEPWQMLLKRKDANAYAQAEQQAHRLLEDFEQRLQQEIDKLRLDATDSALLADARKDIGPGIMRKIRYEAMSGLTNRYLQPEVAG